MCDGPSLAAIFTLSLFVDLWSCCAALPDTAAPGFRAFGGSRCELLSVLTLGSTPVQFPTSAPPSARVPAPLQ